MTSKNKEHVKSWDQYTDKDNVDFTKSEYKKFDMGDGYIIGEGKNRRTAGYVRGEVGHRADGK